MTNDNQSDEYWKQRLSPAQFEIMREKGTEPAFSGNYVDMHEDGIYHCGACGHELFSSETKFESGSGWPSFTSPMATENIMLVRDESHGMVRTEVTCAHCGAHLGHVFDDGPSDKGGMRYCINSLSLAFDPEEAIHEN